MNPEWRMTFSFGNWMNVRKALANLGLSSADDLEEYFTRLMVKDLYSENIMAQNINMVWLDPDNTIDLSKIGDNLDNLPDGEVYARVKMLHIDAGQLKLDENILYKAGYNPTEKMAGDADLDDIPDGVTYQRAKSAALTAAGLVILDQVVVGTYGLVKSAYISAGRILLEQASGDLDDISNGSTYKKVKATDISAGHIKLYVDQDLDNQGIEIETSSGGDKRVRLRYNGLLFYNGSTKIGNFNQAGNVLGIESASGKDMQLYTGNNGQLKFRVYNEDIVCFFDSIGEAFRDANDNRTRLGTASKRWSDLYAVTVHQGDSVFENNWRFTETEDKKGIRLLRPDGSLAKEWR